jgi:hypothetical protein
MSGHSASITTFQHLSLQFLERKANLTGKEKRRREFSDFNALSTFSIHPESG